MSLFDIVNWLGQFGPWVSLAVITLGFFLWKDWRREVCLQDRVEKLEQQQKEVILPLVAQCVEVIAQNTLVMERIEKVIKGALAAQSQNERCVLDRLIEDAAEHRGE